MVFDFLKKKFRGLVSEVAPGDAAPDVPAVRSYEERRAEAEALHEAGRTEESVAALEQLAADLAGEGSFPLAVAVRHQISAWNAAPPVAQTAGRDGEEMARRREESGTFRVPPGGLAPAPAIPEGLERSRFFADMTSEEIAGFITSTDRRTFAEGDVVLEHGSQGRSLFIVTRGLLRVEAPAAGGGGTLRMGVLTTGDVFGEVAFLTGRPRTATVIAETGAECLEISSEAWTGILGEFPRVRQVLEDVHRERARFAADAILEDLRRRREAGDR
ncbi:MAG: cyclic nucleotide-binding domain-containing protein [Thermoanaerobaculia bacterium]|nr:cyclic nucleotide-binding domain-containing protein [Thermoanaerobaculia bacterium]